MSDAQRGSPAVVEDLALGAFRMVKEKLGFELDFTPETLPVLDHYLISLREEDGGSPDEKVVAVVAPCAGAYYGEVMRRALPELRWNCESDDYQRWRIEGEHVFLSFNPIGVALEAIYGRAVEGWNAHLTLRPAEQRVVESSLESGGPVREGDFFRLAVRHEVLEQALAVLSELARRRGPPEHLGAEAYAELDPIDSREVN